jgi:cellulose synthase operon protein C
MSQWQDLMDASHYLMLLSQGDKALDRKDYPSARRAFEQARKARPRDADALDRAGRGRPR